MVNITAGKDMTNQVLASAFGGITASTVGGHLTMLEKRAVVFVF